MEKNFGGNFIINPGPRELIVPNTIVSFGAEALLKFAFQDDDSDFPASWFMGLTNASYEFDTAGILAALAAEEPTGNGYERQELPRDAPTWDVSLVNNLWRARSSTVTFTASAGWDKDWSRMFLTDQETGTAGDVFCVSGAQATPQTVLSGLGPPLAYEFWVRV